MCGIIACRTQTPAIDYLLRALHRLEYRGYDSAGVAVQTTGGDVARLRTVGRVQVLDDAVQRWDGPQLDGVGIGHTRWATHGLVSEQNAHPHQDCTGRISLVHNGILDDAVNLRTALTLAGHEFASEVDSEVLCHLIEDQLEQSGDLTRAVRSALASLSGSWAVAVLERGTGRVVVAAQGSPLLVANTGTAVFAASDIAAIAEWVDEFRVLEDGEVVELVDSDGVVGAAGNSVSPRMTRCVWRKQDAELNGYADYMAKEVDEQPAAAARVLDELAGGIASGALARSLALPPFDRVQIMGCGSSLNAGRAIGNMVRRVSGLPVTLTIASEASDEVVEPGTLCLAISQSGETADVLSALAGRSPDVPVVAITNNMHSTLARRSQAVVNCAAGPEIGVAATKTFVCQVLAGSALMLSALVAKDLLNTSDAAALADDLRAAPENLAAAGTVAKCLVPPLAEDLFDAAGYLFIARGAGLPYAAEGALKLKELSYRWAEYYPAGELKHGPLALIDSGTPVVVVDSFDPKLAANVAEAAARGGRILRIGGADSTIPVIRDTVAPWGPLEAVIPMQVLARTIGLALGCDVDKPRNLAKSVTVE